MHSSSPHSQLVSVSQTWGVSTGRGEAAALGVSVASGALWTPCWEHLLNVHNEKYLYQPDHSDPLNSVPSAQTGGSFQSRAQSAHRQSLLVAETETTCISQTQRKERISITFVVYCHHELSSWFNYHHIIKNIKYMSAPSYRVTCSIWKGSWKFVPGWAENIHVEQKVLALTNTFYFGRFFVLFFLSLPLLSPSRYLVLFLFLNSLLLSFQLPFHFQHCLFLLSFFLLSLSVLWISFHPHFLSERQCSGPISVGNRVCVCGGGWGVPSVLVYVCMLSQSPAVRKKQKPLFICLCIPMHPLQSLRNVGNEWMMPLC